MKTFNDYISLNEALKIGSKERIHNQEGTQIKIQDTYIQVTGSKPQGFWYGFGDSWMKWVKDNMPDWEFDNYFKVEVDKSKMCVIDSKQKAAEFTDRYAHDQFSIKWNEVAKSYSGIEIPDFSVYFPWLGTWDVSSGCIWDKSAIKKIKLLK